MFSFYLKITERIVIESRIVVMRRVITKIYKLQVATNFPHTVNGVDGLTEFIYIQVTSAFAAVVVRAAVRAITVLVRHHPGLLINQ